MVKTSFTIVTIDGGAASGKSSTSKGVAERLNYLHVDTGAHYRAITLGCINARIAAENDEVLREFLDTLELDTKVVGREAYPTLRGRLPNADELRSARVNELVSVFAAIPVVRETVKHYQRSQEKIARKHGFAGMVMDGRDIGTVIFPDADHKFFLTADPATREARRASEGQDDTIALRDKQDSDRITAPMKPAEDARIIDNSSMTLEEVIDTVCEAIRQEK